VRRVLRCPSKQGISSLLCSCAFSACWVGEVFTQYLILISYQLYITFKCMSLGFKFEGGMDRQGRLLVFTGSSSCIICRPSLIRVCWVSFGA